MDKNKLGIWPRGRTVFTRMVGLLYGGIAVIQNLILRLILTRSGHKPADYAHFLDTAAEHIFLRKVGGGYIFVHRLLMEYFAELDTR